MTTDNAAATFDLLDRVVADRITAAKAEREVTPRGQRWSHAKLTGRILALEAIRSDIERFKRKGLQS